MINEVTATSEDANVGTSERKPSTATSSISQTVADRITGLSLDPECELNDPNAYIIEQIISSGLLPKEETTAITDEEPKYEETQASAEIRAADVSTEPVMIDTRLLKLVATLENTLSREQLSVVNADLKNEPSATSDHIILTQTEHPINSEPLSPDEVYALMNEIRTSIILTRLLTVITGHEHNFSCYTNGGLYFRDICPRSSNTDDPHGSVSSPHTITHEGHTLKTNFVLHTHAGIDQPLALSTNPIDFSDDFYDLEEGQSDWKVILTRLGDAPFIEAVMTEDGSIIAVHCNGINIQTIKERHRMLLNQEIDDSEIEMLETPGIYTDVLIKHLLDNICTQFPFEDHDKVLAHLFGFRLFVGNLEDGFGEIGYEVKGK